MRVTVNVYIFLSPFKVPDDGEPDILYSDIQIKLLGHDRVVLRSYQEFLKMAATELDVNIKNM